ncbi:short chain dehydrogenase/reductase [Sporothrix schenckii 1099-18]|uniref:Short chain dehydrogenase/reductase n=1 Tax=Sporothrix schenckii 1099-18 TaxID=1397361 RepID=A0A0F2LWP3_SPOSC|nr:short chain dehydrogenase/reductase [Sporothrix schenckii 1099-18]KJR81892.1 short chain dehydrogenase/reductase [Sporothrix schenckii 1099-18]
MIAFITATAAAAIDSLPTAVTRLAVLYAGVKVAHALYKFGSFCAVYLRPSQLYRYVYDDANGNPPWALVTGASDGVGVAFADQLAAAGLNVVLHGRNKAKLDGVRKRLAEKHPQRQFRLFVADATRVCHPVLTDVNGDIDGDVNASLSIDNLVEAHLGDLHLTVLINNAGGGLPSPTYGSLAETSSTRIVDNMNLNGVFPLVLTARFLELLQRRRQQPTSSSSNPALIMNIGSLADIGFPFVTPYAASKVLIMAATSMARRELEALGQGGIQMLAVRFGSVTGVSHTKSAPSLLVPDTDTMARASLARTGSHRDVVIGHLPQALQNLALVPLPAYMLEQIFKGVMMARRTKEMKEMSEQKKSE